MLQPKIGLTSSSSRRGSHPDTFLHSSINKGKAIVQNCPDISVNKSPVPRVHNQKIRNQEQRWWMQVFPLYSFKPLLVAISIRKTFPSMPAEHKFRLLKKNRPSDQVFMLADENEP